MSSILQKCADGFKTILTSQDFGSEYEFLCTQLSIEWLRINMWAEAFGLDLSLDPPPMQNPFNRLDVEATVNRTIANITFILTEIDALRKQYEVKPRLDQPNRLSKAGFSSQLSIRPISMLRQRIQDNQKQKSILTLRKWSNGDAKKFAEKVNKVKALIDSLESIAPAPKRETPAPVVKALEERPPPYMEIERVRRTMHHATTESQLTRAQSNSALILQQEVFQIFISGLPASTRLPNTRLIEKMTRLSDSQFKELCTDVYDDFLRRQDHSSQIESLPPVSNYHVKRNEARSKLSTLRPHRFQQLVMDLMVEMQRRLPDLDAAESRNEEMYHSEPSSLDRTRHASDMSGLIACPPIPSPNIQDVAISHGNSSEFSLDSLNSLGSPNRTSSPLTQAQSYLSTRSSTQTLPTSTFSTLAHPTRSLSTTPSSTTNIELFKSFHVSRNALCPAVILAAMKKHNASGDPAEFMLYVVYGDKERKVGEEEKPWRVFQGLKEEGASPLFMLRKVQGGRVA